MKDTRLYIGNLKWSIDDHQLAEIFGKYGNVLSADVIIDRTTQISRGFAFVTFATPEEAKLAIEGLNGKEVEGRALKVNVARPEGSASPYVQPNTSSITSIDPKFLAFINDGKLNEQIGIDVSGKYFVIQRTK